MQTLGHIHNGVVILDEGVSLPEGTRVYVSVLPPAVAAPEIECTPGELPLVRGAAAAGRRVVLPIFDFDGPPDIDLTNERIAEILDREDAST
jgi:hypothetical protein